MSETEDYDKSAIPKAHGPTHEKDGDDEVDADSQLNAYTDARARTAIDDIFNALGVLQRNIDCHSKILDNVGVCELVNEGIVRCTTDGGRIYISGSRLITNASYMILYARGHATKPKVIEYYLNGILKAYFAANGKFYLAEDLLVSGNVGIKTPTPTAALDINSDIFRMRTAKTPASAGATGNTGDICWDAEYVYVCVDTDTWKRTAITTW